MFITIPIASPPPNGVDNCIKMASFAPASPATSVRSLSIPGSNNLYELAKALALPSSVSDFA